MPKKSKKVKKEIGPEIRTTRIILNERIKMFCPRMGDTYTRTIKVEEILEVFLSLSLLSSRTFFNQLSLCIYSFFFNL